jgi:peptidoglycan L-alanyl-D-glutamate endopeptidase CwlK
LISSHDLKELHPRVQERALLFRGRCSQEGINFLIICTYRDIESQNALYAQGRTLPGHIVTNAKGGDSFHQWRCAFDGVPVVGGKPLWQVFGPDGKMLPTWIRVGEIAKECGLEWAGTWKSFKEYDHFQYTGGLTLAQLKEGKVIA